MDWADIERYRGQPVSLEGTFNQIQGDHGVVTLDSGLKIYLPNIALTLRGRPWFNYLQKRVIVGGILRTEACKITGYSGPSLQEINTFSVIN